MATITEVRNALADLLRTRLELSYGDGRVPSPLQPHGVFVIPQPGTDYLTFEDGTFCKPTIRLSAIVVGPTTNLDEAAAWLDDAIAIVHEATRFDSTLGGRVSQLVLAAISEPGTIVVEQGGLYLSAELRFLPFFITGGT